MTPVSNNQNLYKSQNNLSVHPQIYTTPALPTSPITKAPPPRPPHRRGYYRQWNRQNTFHGIHVAHQTPGSYVSGLHLHARLRPSRRLCCEGCRVKREMWKAPQRELSLVLHEIGRTCGMRTDAPNDMIGCRKFNGSLLLLAHTGHCNISSQSALDCLTPRLVTLLLGRIFVIQ